jgi:glycosyltransferase involved in cell wall biosynthesis
MLRNFITRLENSYRAMVKASDYHPVVYNANKAKESKYLKRALLVYLPMAFLLEDDDPKFLTHQNLRQCRQIAVLLDEFGYIVDVVHWRDIGPPWNRNYDLILSDRADLKGADALLKKNAIKIFLATSDNYIVHNRLLLRRHESLAQRRGPKVMVRRIYPEALPYLMKSDALIGFGNEFIMNTWKEVFNGPTYAFNNYGFDGTEFPLDSKDFATARHNFLFFASHSQVQKGLDLLLEIFPRHPELHLYVCSDFEKEKDFCACYHKELYKTPNIHAMGWVTVNSSVYYELVRKCAYVVHPTCSEGQPGSVVQCMYSGLIPIVTREAGIDTEDFGITFLDDSLEEIERLIIEISQLPESWHRTLSTRTRRISEEKYSESAFMNRWRNFLTAIIDKRQ